MPRFLSVNSVRRILLEVLKSAVFAEMILLSPLDFHGKRVWLREHLFEN
jgi:hypothetical protein